MATNARDIPLRAIFWRFLRFGCLAWGGPIAQIAMIKRELVEEQRWVSPSKFNRLLAIYQLLPGPEAHELCVHFGVLKGRRLGGLLAGLGFMLPGLVLILLLAWAYRLLDLRDPSVAALFAAIQIAVLAVIARAVHRIGEHALSSRLLLALALASAALTMLDVSFWVVLPIGGLVAATARARPWHSALLLAGALTLLSIALWRWSGPAPTAGTVIASPSTVPPGIVALFLAGLKGGLLTFGGAYTAIPFIRDDAVGKGWVTDGQFLDGLALSNIIPAPLIIFATFVGYLAGGFAGALAMTAGMFLPAFAFGILLYDQVERVIEDQRLHRFLEGVAAGVVGVVAVTLLEMGSQIAQAIPVLWPAALLFAACLTVLYRWKSRWATPVLIGAGAMAGALLFQAP